MTIIIIGMVIIIILGKICFILFFYFIICFILCFLMFLPQTSIATTENLSTVTFLWITDNAVLE